MYPGQVRFQESIGILLLNEHIIIPSFIFIYHYDSLTEIAFMGPTPKSGLGVENDIPLVSFE